ncbi:MAG: hypothetical protein EBT33_01685 [Betaproteobacteria bacterium]|nr:hypothetical protein [Betaproteobacteria bacterium]
MALRIGWQGERPGHHLQQTRRAACKPRGGRGAGRVPATPLLAFRAPAWPFVGSPAGCTVSAHRGCTTCDRSRIRGTVCGWDRAQDCSAQSLSDGARSDSRLSHTEANTMNVLPGNGLSLDYVSQTMLTAVSNAETTLRATIQAQAASQTQTPSDLLVLQKQIQEWAMITQLQSTVVKELADAAKSVIQKSA